ncbi:MAG: gliding motility-associated C-terminal domain-containing protein [Bacteroidota bacterium]
MTKSPNKNQLTYLSPIFKAAVHIPTFLNQSVTKPRTKPFGFSKHGLVTFVVLVVISFFGKSQTGPGGVGNATGSTGQPRNIVWLDASYLSLSNGDDVAVWGDRSGNGNDASRGPIAQQPAFVGTSLLNGRPFIRFDGVDDALSLDTSIATNSEGIVNRDYSFVFVGARRTSTGNDGWLLYGTGPFDAQSNLYVGWRGGNPSQFRFSQFGASELTVSGRNYLNDGVNQYAIFTGTFNQSDSPPRRLYENAGLIGTNPNNQVLTSYPGAELGGISGSNECSVDIAEAIFFQGTLNEAQVTIINNYLNAKYNLSLVGFDGVNRDFYNGDIPANGDFDYDVIGIGQVAGSTHEQAISEGFSLTANASLDADGEYIFAGHDDTPMGVTNANLEPSIAQRWSRSWYVERTGDLGTTFSFDLGIIAMGEDFNPNPSDYVLLRWNGSLYQEVSLASSDISVEGSTVRFNMTASNLLNGKYTLGTRNATQTPLDGFDADVDGIKDNADLDDDNDGIPDSFEQCFFEENFDDSSLDAFLEESGSNDTPAVNIDYSFNIARFTHPTSSTRTRNYIRTVENGFYDQNVQFEVTAIIPSSNSPAGTPFVGLGPGEASTAYFGEPLHPILGANIRLDLNRLYFHDKAPGDAYPTSNSEGLSDVSNTQVRFRIRWNATARLARIEVDTDYDGISFVTDHSRLFDGSDNAFNSTNMRVYFGGGNGIVFDDFEMFVDCDTDLDGVPNRVDLDSDNDGIYELVESGSSVGGTDGRILSAVGFNGLPNSVETAVDSGILNYVLNDSDSDTLLNFLELDSDADTCSDAREAGFTDNDLDGFLGNSPVTTDVNGLVLGQGGYTTPIDADGNGKQDYTEAGAVPIIEKQPESLEVTVGDPAQFEVIANGDTFQWQVSTDAGISFTDLTGEVASTLNLTGTTLSEDGNLYRVIVANSAYSCETVTSFFGVLRVYRDWDADGVNDKIDLDDDNDGIPDTVECAENNSTLNLTGDFSGSQTGGSPLIVSASNAGGVGPSNSNFSIQISSDVQLTLGAGELLESFELRFTIGRFDDGLKVDIDGNTILNFNQTHWRNDTDFQIPGRFNSDGNTSGSFGWTPWTGEGNPELVITPFDIKLLLDTRTGGRENALPYMLTHLGTGDNEFIYNPANLEIVNGFLIDLFNSNQATATRLQDVTLSVIAEICTDTDGDSIYNSNDLDSDNDGITDAVESGHGLSDTNGLISAPFGANGLANSAESTPDSGLLNYVLSDSDSDSQQDFLELDSDADGCSDANEAYQDSNADGTDGFQYGLGNPPTTDSDGLVISSPYNQNHPDARDASVSAICQQADLELDKTVSSTNPNVGDTIRFTISLNNLGPVTAENVTVQDVVPEGYTIDQTSISNGGVLNGNTITWNFPIVGIGALQLTYDVVVNVPTGVTNQYENVAQVIAMDQIDPDSIPNNDDGDQSEDDEDSATIDVPSTDLEIVKSVDISQANIDDIVVFAITVTNLGTYSATNGGIEDVVPNGYEIVQVDAQTGTFNAVDSVWDIPSLGPGNAAVLNMTVRVTDGGDYLNEARLVYLDQLDSNPNNDYGQAQITMLQSDCLTVYNGLSADGNGLNDVFFIECIEDYPENMLRIFNRWGSKVYERKGYDNSWDGISEGSAMVTSDRNLPVGTYYYILELNDGRTPARTGWLYITR